MKKNYLAIMPKGQWLAVFIVVSVLIACGSDSSSDSADATDDSKIEAVEMAVEAVDSEGETSAGSGSGTAQKQAVAVEEAVDTATKADESSAVVYTPSPDLSEAAKSSWRAYGGNTIIFDMQGSQATYSFAKSGTATLDWLDVNALSSRLIGDWKPLDNGIELQFHTFEPDYGGKGKSYRVERWFDGSYDEITGERLVEKISIQTTRPDGTVYSRDLAEWRVTDWRPMKEEKKSRTDSAGTLVIERLEAMTVLAPTKLANGDTIFYGPDNMLDRDPVTAWNDGSDGDGSGEVLEIGLRQSTSADFLTIMPGYFDARWHKANNRVKTLEVTLLISDDVYMEKSYPLKDEMVLQQLALDRVFFDTIRLKIVDVYPGEQWNDLAISEVGLTRNDKEVTLVLADDVAIVPPNAVLLPPEQLAAYSILFAASTSSSVIDIFSVKGDGSELTNLTESEGTNVAFDYSAETGRIVFSSNRDGDSFSLYTMNVDGSDVRMLPAGTGSLYAPEWSPSGDRVAFLMLTDDREYEVGIYNIDLDTTTNFPISVGSLAYWGYWNGTVAARFNWDESGTIISVEYYDVRGATPIATIIGRQILSRSVDPADTDDPWTKPDATAAGDDYLDVKNRLWSALAPHRFEIPDDQISLFVLDIDGDTDLFIGTSEDSVQSVFDNDGFVLEVQLML